MTMQIAVRLPDEIVAFLDECVEAGLAPSRAALVTQAVERERRRQAALADAKILETGVNDDLDELVNWSTQHAPFED